MKQNFQASAIVYGESGCYLDSLLESAGGSVDRLRYYRRAFDMKWMQEDCYILEPAEILQDLTYKAWICNKQGADYKCKPGEVEILRYERVKAGVTLSHFVLGDGMGNIKYDPMGDNSPTVRYGTLVSKRIFTEVKV